MVDGMQPLFRTLMIVALVMSGMIDIAPGAETNILILFVDDLGSGDLGSRGGAARTPNIDRLGREGVEFQRYYGYPLCSPARAALLTGQMPRRYGIAHALGAREPGLPANLPTLPRTLRAAGYQTWLVGKWHLGTASPPLQSGFDHFYGFEGPEVDYYQHTNRRGDVDWQRNGTTIREEGYSTFLLADEAISLIERRDAAKPFYLQVTFNAPHFPLAAPESFLAKYSHLNTAQRLRAAVVDALDDSIGRILEALDENGLRNNTLVVFLSDNGADQTGRNAPYRGGKGSVYEGGIRVPCFMRWPEQLASGATVDQPMSAQDLYPTLTDAVGVSMGAARVDGMSLWPAIRHGKDVVRSPFVIAGADCSLFDGDWKLIETSAGRVSLFNIVKDPRETMDLANDETYQTQRLQTELATIKQLFSQVSVRPRPGPQGPGRLEGRPGGPRNRPVRPDQQ